jgi:S-adenosylmethionine:tRNA ribosyltransferase-isomerase
MTAVLELPKLEEATLPAELRGIARDGVRLLVTDRAQRRHEDRSFYEIPAVLRGGDLLVVNDSATLPAALRARRSNGDAIALHVGTALGDALRIVEPRGPVNAGEYLDLGLGGSATMLAPLDRTQPRLWYARFDLPIRLNAFLAKVGEPIRYGYVTERIPLSAYQTAFARVPGSAEMPSAARPFTEDVVRALRRTGVAVATITLHCGISSLEAPERPGPERYVVPAATARAVNAAQREGRRVIAAGTTVVRALESSLDQGEAIASHGWTEHVIDPDHPPHVTNGLLTGFHDPAATHVDLLRAFLDEGLLRDAYDAAARGGYLCHEFGDVHLIL